MMVNDLFVRMSKYPPTAAITPLENFFTELIAYFMERETAACQDFLQMLLGNGAGDFLVHKVATQELTKSENVNLSGLVLDLVLRSDNSELFVENKVDSKLGRDQLRNYLNYASERPNARVVVVSRDHNEIVEDKEFKGAPRFLGEILWWEVADRWSKGKAYSNQFLVDSVLRFMEAKQMGPLEQYRIEEMAAPALWKSFSDKTDKVLHRLSKRIRQPDWTKDGKLKWQGVFSGGKVGVHFFNGLLWYVPYNPAKPAAGDSAFWYFVGFRFGSSHWLPPLLEEGQPECIVSTDVWQPETVSKLMLEEAKHLNSGLSAPAFEVGYSENRQGVSLFRRRQLKHFIEDGGDQAAAILAFLEQSHEKLWPAVPKIHEHYRQGA